MRQDEFRDTLLRTGQREQLGRRIDSHTEARVQVTRHRGHVRGMRAKLRVAAQRAIGRDPLHRLDHHIGDRPVGAADADIDQRLAGGAMPLPARIEFVEHIRRNRREAVERHTGK